LIRGYNGIYRIGLDGSARLIEKGDRYVEAFALSPDGKKYASLSTDGYGRVELRLTDSDGRNGRTLETIDDPTRDFAMGEFRVVSWPSFDGLEIGGYEIRPLGFDPKKRYPMLVDVHGGGPGSRLYLMGGVIGSTIERHLWAAKGYVVFVPDYRSAAPYGPGVIEKMRGSSFSVIDNRDVMAGVDWMVSRGYIDPDRIALLGQSAGAHRANVLLPTTTRFRAAISNEGWANGWLTDSTGPSTGHWEWPIHVWFFKGTRVENPEAWFGEDPMTRLHEIKTPTLLISGSKELGGIGGMTNEYIFSMLKRNGTDTKLILFQDEGHGTTRLANRRYLMQTAIDWVESHLDLKRDESGRLLFDGDRVASR
jgi:dipeptidyl aminopeptidase/acylaminoacyl peptidase